MVSGVTVTVTVLLSLAGLVSPGAVTVALLTIGDAPVYGLAKLTVNANALLAPLAKTDVLVIDDWGLAPLTDESRRDLLEIFDDRHGTRSS